MGKFLGMTVDFQAPIAVDFRIIGTCNLSCEFCFGPRHHLVAMPLSDVLRIIDEVGRTPAKTMVFSGGEPLLHPGLGRMLEAARAVGLQTVVSTNAIRLRRLGPRLLPFIEWLAIPIDGLAKGNGSMRTGALDHLQRALEAFDFVRRDWPRTGVKIGTVVTGRNWREVPRIPELFSGRALPDVWKLYEFSPTSYGADNASEFVMTPGDFETVVVSALEAAREWGTRTVVYRNAERDGKYVFLDPDYEVRVVENGMEISIGDLRFESVAVILDRAASRIDLRRNMKNVEETYPARPVDVA